jgi:tripartite-type tricarboxylate transporter receptor subunit TctC
MGMNLRRRQILQLAGGALAAPAIARLAQAQTWPSRPITLVVPYPPGGPTDTIARLLAERMRSPLGQPVVVENTSGAGGTIAVTRVARAPGDGYTVGIGHWGSHVINGAVYSLPVDLLTDLVPIALISEGPQLLTAAKNVPAKNLNELVAWLKANPGKGLIGTTGVGGASHLAAVLFAKTTGTELQIVPYRGTAPRMQDMLAGTIHLAFDQVAGGLPLVQAGSLQCYAVTAKTRLAVAPNVPTVDEAGLPGFYMSVWHGLWASKGTPADAIQKLNAATVEALGDATVRQRLIDLGQELPARERLTPEALGIYQKAEIEKWWPIVKAAGIKVE